MSLRAKQMDDIGCFLRLVIIIEHIVLVTFAFLNLARTKVVNYESKNTGLHRRRVTLPDGSREPLGVLTLIPGSFFSNVNHVGLLQIHGHGFGTA